MPTREQIEQRMAEGFLPDENIAQEFRASRALEYIAFVMGRIDRNLARLTQAVESIATRQS